jgi:hypothetical protein
MPDLEQQLATLSETIDWPSTPDLRGRVLPIHGEVSGAAGRRGRWALALAAAAVLVIVASLLAYTPSRDAIAGWLNLHTTVHRVPQLPTPSPPPGQSLGLGTPTTLAQAQSKLTWTIALPQSLGPPDAVYLSLPPVGPSGGEVTLVYTARPGIRVARETGVSVLVTEARGKVNEQFFAKMLGPDTTLETVSVNGHAGWWISGQPNAFVFTDADGNPYTESLRLATNTLIFDDNGTIVRIEGDMTKAQALQLAGSL